VHKTNAVQPTAACGDTDKAQLKTYWPSLTCCRFTQLAKRTPDDERCNCTDIYIFLEDGKNEAEGVSRHGGHAQPDILGGGFTACSSLSKIRL